MRSEPYADREEAGRELATLLAARLGGAAYPPGPTVLALPRGGVPVGHEVARALGGVLDVLVVRKLGLPRQPELAMGAIAGVGADVEVVRNEAVLTRVDVPGERFEAVCRAEVAELRRREQSYRGGRAPAPVTGRAVIVVDDGIATGSTVRAACAAVRRRHPARLIVAVPVAAADVVRALAADADEIVCAWTPAPFHAVGQGYRDFAQVPDERVRALLTGGGNGWARQ
jgi:predicted phosphoribosyltransferase